MGIAGIKMRVMPKSPEVDLGIITEKIKKLVEKEGGKNKEYSEEPIAFGLKAVIAFFEWPEEKPLEKIEEDIKKIENVNSIQVIDMRRLI
ncbi:elongation factor 1-beta [Candidatus Pacearchaeota archaeon]|nr:MAG: elongation factor 1-beta [Candidatus Pacearchaeota archaeon]